MGTPGVKSVLLFLKYFHPWKLVVMRDPLSGWLYGDWLKNIPLVMNLTEK